MRSIFQITGKYCAFLISFIPHRGRLFWDGRIPVRVLQNPLILQSFENLACCYCPIKCTHLPIHSCHRKGGMYMKGYVTASGYMGYVEGEYILFASEEDYREYVSAA